MLNVSEADLKLIKSILLKYPYQFYAFGSRVKGKEKKYSDLDLCVKDEISDVVLSKINEEFEESSLLYKVDIVSWHRCDANFQKNIEKDFVLIN
jgi:predicted nucleotidyltransferase